MGNATHNEQDCLRFFGKVSASISHEIKNVFAVINEAAGLLSDLTLMAEKGMPIDPGRLKRVAQSIQGQIQRGDTIVRNMNRLAHSTDDGVQTVELQQILELSTGLATRMADMKQVRLELGDCQPVTATVAPYDLIRLLYEAMALAMDTMASQATLVLSLARRGDDAVISLGVPAQGINLRPDDALTALAADMGAAVAADTEHGTLEISFGATG